MIKENRMLRDKALKIIYQTNREKVCSYILSNSGDEDEAKDVYQESMIAFYENVCNERFKGDSAISTYIYSIARFKWLNQIKKRGIRVSHHMEAQDTEEFHESPLVKLLDKEQQERIHEVLATLGAQCKKILIESIYHNSSIKEIAANEGYSSEQIVRNKKYKCLKKLKELIAAKPSLVAILKGHG